MRFAVALSQEDETSRALSRRGSMTEPEKPHTLDVPGAVAHHDVRSNDSSTAPVLLLVGSPIGAAGFGTLAGHLADRTVVTYAPAGCRAANVATTPTESTPDEHADDLHRLIPALNVGPVDSFASSGGAVDALALGASGTWRGGAMSRLLLWLAGASVPFGRGSRSDRSRRGGPPRVRLGSGRSRRTRR
jgi:hypothetical protein